MSAVASSAEATGHGIQPASASTRSESEPMTSNREDSSIVPGLSSSKPESGSSCGAVESASVEEPILTDIVVPTTPEHMTEATPRAPMGRATIVRASAASSGSRSPTAIRVLRCGPRNDQGRPVAVLPRTESRGTEIPRLCSQSSPSIRSPMASPKRRRMTSFQHAFLMCGAKAEPITPQKTEGAHLQTPSAPTLRRNSPSGPGRPVILGRSTASLPGVRTISIGGNRNVRLPALSGLPGHKPIVKQVRESSTESATPTENAPKVGANDKPDNDSTNGADVLNQIKREVAPEGSTQVAEMPDVIARMMQIHAPVAASVKLPIGRPSFLNLQMRRDFATISSNGDVGSVPTVLPPSYTVSVEKAMPSKDGCQEKSTPLKVRVPPKAPTLRCGLFVVKHQEKTGVKLQSVPSLRGDAVAWLDPRGPFENEDGSRGTGPYLMYARSEDKETNRRRFACAHHGCKVTLTADIDTMLVLRRCGAFHRHENSEADLNKRQTREKLRKRLRLYDGTRTAAEVIREFPELCAVDSEEHQREIKKAAVNIRRSPIDGEKISRWGKQLSEVMDTVQALESLSKRLSSPGSPEDETILECLRTAIGYVAEIQRPTTIDLGKSRRPRKRRKRCGKSSARGRRTGSRPGLEDEEDQEAENDYGPESPGLLQGLDVESEGRPIIDTGNSVAAVREEPHRCGECSQAFWAWANLVRHLRVMHKQPIVDCNSTRCSECGVVMRATDAEIESHLDFHGYLGRLRFTNMKDVHIWRLQQETEGGRPLLKIREESGEGRRTTMWVCPRRPDVECRVLECEFCPMATTSDPLACPVFVKAIEDLNDGSVEVRFTSKHSNACLQWNITATCFLHSVRRHVASVAESDSRPVVLCKDIHQMNEVHPSLLRDDFLAVFCDLNQVRLLSRLTDKHSLTIECLAEGIKLTTVSLLSYPSLDGSEPSPRNGSSRNTDSVHGRRINQKTVGNPHKLSLVHVISTAADEPSLLAAFSELRRYTGRVRAKVLVDAAGSTASKCCHAVAREAWRRAMGLDQTQLIDPVSLALAAAEDSSHSSFRQSESRRELPLMAADQKNDSGAEPTLTSSNDLDPSSKVIDFSEEVEAVTVALQQDALRRDLDRLRDHVLDARAVLGQELRGAAPADDIQKTLAEACALLADARTSQGVHGQKPLIANGRLALERLKEAIRLLVEPPVREHNECSGSSLPLGPPARLGDENRHGAGAHQVALGVAVNQTLSHVVGHTVVGAAAPVAIHGVAHTPDIPLANAVVNTVTGQSGSADGVPAQPPQVALVGSHVPTPVAVTSQIVSGGLQPGCLLSSAQVVAGYPTPATVQVHGQAWAASQLIPINNGGPPGIEQPIQIQSQHRQAFLDN